MLILLMNYYIYKLVDLVLLLLLSSYMYIQDPHSNLIKLEKKKTTKKKKKTKTKNKQTKKTSK